MDKFECIAATIIVGILLMIPAAPVLGNYLKFITAEEKVEQLRIDLANTDIRNNEDVLGQVTEWNQTIRAWRRLNKVPVICWWVPNGWDSIDLLEIPYMLY